MQDSLTIATRNIDKLLQYMNMSRDGLANAIQESGKVHPRGEKFPEREGLRKRLVGIAKLTLTDIDYIADFFGFPVAVLLLPDFDPADIPEYIRVQSFKDLFHVDGQFYTRPPEISPETWSRLSEDEKELYRVSKRTQEETEDFLAFYAAGLPDLFPG